MSRGFVKEDDQEEVPIIPPRAALPPGVINYVTANGMEQLKVELNDLEEQIKNLQETDERERRLALGLLNGKRNLLIERLNSARLLPAIKSKDEVRFGATVTYQIGSLPQSVTITIVGVDEADVSQQKIAFTAPIAKALIGAKVGDTIDFQLGNEVKQLKVKSLNYH